MTSSDPGYGVESEVGRGWLQVDFWYLQGVEASCRQEEETQGPVAEFSEKGTVVSSMCPGRAGEDQTK